MPRRKLLLIADCFQGRYLHATRDAPRSLTFHCRSDISLPEIASVKSGEGTSQLIVEESKKARFAARRASSGIQGLKRKAQPRDMTSLCKRKIFHRRMKCRPRDEARRVSCRGSRVASFRGGAMPVADEWSPTRTRPSAIQFI